MVSTHDRLFGSAEGATSCIRDPAKKVPCVLPTGPCDERPKAAALAGQRLPSKDLGNGLCAEASETCNARVLGSRKQRVEEPAASDAVTRLIFSPRNQLLLQSLRAPSPRQSPRGRSPDALAAGTVSVESPRPLQRRFPAADTDNVPLGSCSITGFAGGRSARSASPRGAQSPRGGQDRRVTSWTHGYDPDSYRSIRVFPSSSHYTSSMAIGRSPSPSQKEEEHGGLLGPDNLPRAACLRHSPENARGTHSSVNFDPAPASASDMGSAAEHSELVQPRWLRGDWNFSIMQKMPSKRHLPPPGSADQLEATNRDVGEKPATCNRADENELLITTSEPPAAGVQSPRYPRGLGLVPRGAENQDDTFRFEAGIGNRRHFGGAGRSGILPRNASGPLDKGLCAEANQFMSDHYHFLGARRGKSPSASPSHSPGSSPLGSPLQSPRGAGAADGEIGGSLSWGAISAGDAAKAKEAQSAAMTVHRTGLRGEQGFNAVQLKESGISNEAVMRRREFVHERRAVSPLARWR